MDVQATTTGGAARDEFLQLLVTQLRNQNPLEPVKQENFLAQLAQFSTLEGIEKMNSKFEDQLAIQTDMLKLQQFSQASAMVGRKIAFEIDGVAGEGRVDSVSVGDILTTVRVGDQTLSIGDVTAVLGEN